MGSLKRKSDGEVEIAGESKEAILYVNGIRRVLPDGLAHLTLLEYLRGSYIYSVASYFCSYIFIMIMPL